MTEQPDFLEQLSCSSKHEIKFREWDKTKGAKFVTDRCIRWAMFLKKRYPHRRFTFSAVWELVRSDIPRLKEKCKRLGIKFKDKKKGRTGYALDNNYRAYMMRKVMEKKPELEFREGVVGEKRRKVVVVVNPKKEEAA